MTSRPVRVSHLFRYATVSYMAFRVDKVESKLDLPLPSYKARPLKVLCDRLAASTDPSIDCRSTYRSHQSKRGISWFLTYPPFHCPPSLYQQTDRLSNHCLRSIFDKLRGRHIERMKRVTPFSRCPGQCFCSTIKTQCAL